MKFLQISYDIKTLR